MGNDSKLLLKALSGRDRLLLETLTRKGERVEGRIGDTASLAAWMDHVNHDGSTAEEIERDLRRLAEEGWIAIADGSFRLLRKLVS